MTDAYEYLLTPGSALERFHRAQQDGTWAKLTPGEREEILDGAIPEASRIKRENAELFQ